MATLDQMSESSNHITVKSKSSRSSQFLLRSKTGVDGSKIEYNGYEFTESEMIHFIDQRERHTGFSIKQLLVAYVY